MRIVSGTALAAGSGLRRRLAPCRSLIATPRFRLDNALDCDYGRRSIPIQSGSWLFLIEIFQKLARIRLDGCMGAAFHSKGVVISHFKRGGAVRSCGQSMTETLGRVVVAGVGPGNWGDRRSRIPAGDLRSAVAARSETHAGRGIFATRTVSELFAETVADVGDGLDIVGEEPQLVAQGRDVVAQ